MHPTYQNQRQEADQVDIFPRTKIQHTDTINAPGKQKIQRQTELSMERQNKKYSEQYT